MSNSNLLDDGINWNLPSDDVMVLLDDDPDIRMIASMYKKHKDYYGKEWRIGYRNALFLTLDADSYKRFIELIGNE